MQMVMCSVNQLLNFSEKERLTFGFSVPRYWLFFDMVSHNSFLSQGTRTITCARNSGVTGEDSLAPICNVATMLHTAHPGFYKKR